MTPNIARGHKGKPHKGNTLYLKELGEHVCVLATGFRKAGSGEKSFLVKHCVNAGTGTAMTALASNFTVWFKLDMAEVSEELAPEQEFCSTIQDGVCKLGRR